MLFRSPTSNYKKSNRILVIKMPVSPTAKILTKKLLMSKETAIRQQLSQDLLDELTDLTRIDIVNVTISEKNQYHKKHKGKTVMKQYGYYKPKERYISTISSM